MLKYLSPLGLILWVGIIYADPILPDPLKSWNEGEAKNKILEYVEEVTSVGGKNFIPAEDRIATFDEDGTLWVEQPIYPEFFFAFEIIRKKAHEHPEWKKEEPFKSILEGNREAILKLSKEDIIKIMAISHANVDIEEFQTQVKDWIEKARHPKFDRPFTELVYQPMLEVMHYLKKKGFDVYIVSGGGQEFIRSFAEKLYGIQPSHVIGTARKIQYEYNEGKPKLIKLPEVLFIDDKSGKPESINLIIGKRPVIAFGNSIGDQQMLEWTQGGKRKSLMLLVHHDDEKREYAYDKDSKVGTFSDALKSEALKQNWIIISMKNDFKVIFSWEKP